MGCNTQDKFDFSIPENADLRIVATYLNDDNVTPVDLTGYTAELQIRQAAGDDQFLMLFTTENGGLTLGGTAGTIVIYSPAYINALLTWNNGVYDFLLISAGGDISKLFYGNVTTNPGSTQLFGDPVMAFSLPEMAMYWAVV